MKGWLRLSVVLLVIGAYFGSVFGLRWLDGNALRVFWPYLIFGPVAAAGAAVIVVLGLLSCWGACIGAARSAVWVTDGFRADRVRSGRIEKQGGSVSITAGTGGELSSVVNERVSGGDE